MGFSEKAKAYFYKELGLDNRGISKRMDNYSESLISRYLNQEKISPTFVLKVRKYFPDADVHSWIPDDDTVQEPSTPYTADPIKRINRMIKDLEDIKAYIKSELPQK